MNYGAILAAMIVVPYSSAFLPGVSGNPERQAYVGQERSTWDAAAHPARANGTVAYNPLARLPAAVEMSPGVNMPNAAAPAAQPMRAR